jgi:hypothetical protein
MGRTKLWKPVTACFVAPGYEWRIIDDFSTIRHGRHVLADNPVAGWVKVKTRYGRHVVKEKKDLIAISVYGPRPRPKLCKVCGDPIRYVCEQLNGNITPWMIDLAAERYHARCLERLMWEFPIHSPNDPIGSHRRNGRTTGPRHSGLFSDDE